MNNETEVKLEAYFKSIRDKAVKQAEEAIGEVYCQLLPYVVGDTEANAAEQARDIVLNIIKGDFEFDGDYAVVQNVREYAPRVRIAFNAKMHDQLRDVLIEKMPVCPKDDKIAALEAELKRAYEIRSY